MSFSGGILTWVVGDNTIITLRKAQVFPFPLCFVVIANIHTGNRAASKSKCTQEKLFNGKNGISNNGLMSLEYYFPHYTLCTHYFVYILCI